MSWGNSLIPLCGVPVASSKAGLSVSSTTRRWRRHTRPEYANPINLTGVAPSYTDIQRDRA